MNIWHLQLHQNKRLSTPEILKIVTEKKVIGLAKSWKNKNGIPVNDPVLFKKKNDNK